MNNRGGESRPALKTIYRKGWKKAMEIEVEIKKKDGTTEKYSYGDKPKRKTKTSSAVKNRYNKKAYKRWGGALKPDLFTEIEEYREAAGLSRPQFLERAMEALRNESKQD